MSTRRTRSLTTAVPIALIVLVTSILGAWAGQDVTVKVPFDFQAGGTHFAAGEYVLSLDTIMSGTVVIQSTDHSRRAMLLARKSISAPVNSAPVVSFRTYGESRFLAAIQSESASHRWEIVPTPKNSPARVSAEPRIASRGGASPAAR